MRNFAFQSHSQALPAQEQNTAESRVGLGNEIGTKTDDPLTIFRLITPTYPPPHLLKAGSRVPDLVDHGPLDSSHVQVGVVSQ